MAQTLALFVERVTQIQVKVLRKNHSAKMI